MRRRWLWLTAGLLLLATATALLASADPDPPLVDGGSTTFVGEWLVDPLDDLVYTNQTIVLDGNLTVLDTGTLTLLNCTLVLNSTFPGERHIDVVTGGTLRVRAGSTLTPGAAGHPWFCIVDIEAHLLLEDSTVNGSGLASGLGILRSGIYTNANDTVVRRVTFQACRVGMAVGAASGVLVEHSVFQSPTLAAVWADTGCSGLALENITLDSCPTGLLAANCTGVHVGNSTFRGGVAGVISRNATVTIVNGHFVGLSGAAVSGEAGGSASWRVDATSSLTDGRAYLPGDLDVVSGGNLTVSNSTLAIVNGVANGTNGIIVGAGGSMRVLAGSLVTNGTGGLRYLWTVQAGGLLTVDGSTVTGAGWNSSMPGLSIASEGNVVKGTRIHHCHVGLSVTGANNTARDLVVENCDVGVSWSGDRSSLYNITVTDCAHTGLRVTGTDRVDLADVTLSLAGAFMGLSVNGSTNVSVTRLTVAGSPFTGVLIESSGYVNLTNLTSTIPGGVHSIQVLSSTDIAIFDANLDGGMHGLYVVGVDELHALSMSVQGMSVDGVYARGTVSFYMGLCVIDAGSGVGINVSTGCAQVLVDNCVVFGSRDLVVFRDVQGPEVRACVLSFGERGIVFDGCTNAQVWSSTILAPDVGIHLERTRVAVLEGCSLDRTRITGVHLDNGTTDAVVSNMTVVSSPTAILVTGPATINNTVLDLVLINCTQGLDLNGTGRSNSVRGTTFVGVPVAIRMVGNSWLGAVDCSFYDCPVAVAGDNSSHFSLVVKGAMELVNSTMTGWINILVDHDGSLNVSAMDITFRNAVSGTFVGIASRDDAMLRIVNGTSISMGPDPGSYTVWAEGTAIVQDSVLSEGGLAGSHPALRIEGDAAIVHNVTFRDCLVGLELKGSFHSVSNCTFEGSGQAVQLVGAIRPVFTNCDLRTTGDSRAVGGTFVGSLQFIRCRLEGHGRMPTGIGVASPGGQNSVLTLKNTTIANFTVWGLEDEHSGSLLMEGCGLVGANITVGSVAAYTVTMRDAHVEDSKVVIGPGPFTVTDCDFLRSGVRVQNSPLGGLMADCTFSGPHPSGLPCLYFESSLGVTVRDVAIDGAAVGMRASKGSEVSLNRCVLENVSLAALEVNGSIVRLEGCALTDLMGTGIRSWNTGSRVEVRNGTIQALPGRTGFDADSRMGGDIWFLNTTFNRSSVASIAGGRVEVLWFVTVEPRLPWGGLLWGPELLSVVDATDTEVVNTTLADIEMRLHEFVAEDGKRAWHTPHNITVDDTRVGVRYAGAHTISRSVHLVLDLNDVQAPVARAGPDQIADEDQVVTLDGTSSSDNDPGFHSSGTYRWSFEEYGTWVNLTGEVARHVFSVPGRYIITLTVVDRAGNEAIDSLIIDVLDRTPPVIRFSGNLTVDEDVWTILEASATTDNDPTFNTTTGSFLWTIHLSEGVLERNVASFSHAFGTPGNYSGTLSVLDKAGNEATVDFWVAVRDVTAPEILGVSNATVFESTSGLLDASACSDNVGITDYLWRVTFKGSTVDIGGVVPGYRFQELGAYAVDLTIVDAAGNSNSTTITVVYDDVPTISIPAWVVAMAGERLSVAVNVSDVHSTGLTVSVANGPAGAVIEGSAFEAELVWTPSAEHAGTEVAVEVEVHDGYKSAQATVIVHVNPARGAGNRPPVILSEPPLSAKMSTPYIYSVDAEDPDGDILGFLLLEGPAGMSISQVGTISWDPPFDHGTILVSVSIRVTDGRDATPQDWTIRWRDPPNRAPELELVFQLPPMEVKVLEPFLVDLNAYVGDPMEHTLDADDPNHALVWSLELDVTMVTLVSEDGLVYRFQALTVPGRTSMNFTVTDPSGASATVAMELTVTKRPGPTDDGGGLWLWLGAVVLLVLAVLAAMAIVASRRRGGWETGLEAEPEGPVDLGPPPEGPSEGAEALARALAPEARAGPEVAAPAGGQGGFVELDVEEAGGVDFGVTEVGATEPIPRVPGGTRVVSAEAEGGRRTFHVVGIAVLDDRGRSLATTGKVSEVLGPYQDTLDEVMTALGGEGSMVLEVEGHRALLSMGGGVGILCLLRGRDDEAFRQVLGAHLQALSLDRSEGASLAAIDDILSAAGKPESAEVVRGAWTAKLATKLKFKGSLVALYIGLRNDTDDILNNVRLQLHYDADALSLMSVRPKMLVSKGRVSMGNVPPRKEQRLEVTLVPELCISSKVRVVATYTDVEGRQVKVPARTFPVEVVCPYIEPGGDVDEERLLSMSEEGLGHTGLRVFTHGIDVDRTELFKMAVRLVVERGPMKVLELDDESLMRSEAWFLGSGEGGSPRVLVRVATHGADHLLELFVTSDHGATATGLLTFLAGELLDAAASAMPGKRVERVRESATLEDVAAWPTLLDYKIMGE